MTQSPTAISDDPPSFLARAPFGYADVATIERDLRLAGFETVDTETVQLPSRPVSASDAATGLVAGSPLRSELEARDSEGLDPAIIEAAHALRSLERDGISNRAYVGAHRDRD